jgi:PKD repeat protein
MPTLNARGSVVAGTTNTTWNTTANAIDGAFGVNNATYCNWTNTTANAVGTIEIGFGSQFAAIPAGSIINSVSVTLRHYESQTTRLANVQFQPYDGATAIGSLFTATRATAARSDTATFNPTLAQLQSATFKVRVTATRFNGTQAGIFYMDYVDVVVDYTAPPVADFTISDATPNVGQQVTFTDTSTGEPTAWAWTFAGGTPDSANTQGPHSVSWVVAGTYDVTLTATNAAGSDPVTKQVVVSGLPLVEVFNGTQWKAGAEVWNGVSWRTDAEVWDGAVWRRFG